MYLNKIKKETPSGHDKSVRHISLDPLPSEGAETFHVKTLSSQYVETDGESQMANGKWQMANGKWQMANGKWQMANGKSQITNPEAYYSMGIALKNQGKSDDAISCFQKALQLNPDFAEAYVFIGNIIQAQGKSEEAISCYQKALDIKPDFAIAYNNMGNIVKDLGRPDKAIWCYKKALGLKPDMGSACNNLFFQLQQICAWEDFRDLGVKVDNLTKLSLNRGIKTDEDPFVNLTRHADPALNFAVAKSHSDNISKFISDLKVKFSSEKRKKKGSSKIVLGYLSKDFHNHATAHLMLGLFRLHNREEFEVFCYSYGKDDGSYYRRRIQADCDKFVDLYDLSHVDAAKCIYKDGVDILVDLKGYTWGNRLEIPALRPAPVQVSYLGFPGTTGADFFDYILTDRIVTPENQSGFYSEKFAYLPNCYQVNDGNQKISDKKWKKADLGLPDEGFVFCSFNRPYKIEPLMFDIWMRILQQVPKSILWLLLGNETAEKNIIQETKARGVNPARLVFAKMLPKDEHLARHKLADLGLDTRIYNGHTTTSDALWAGVPVITLQGSHFASRVSSSLLTAIGLPELITYDPKTYERLAVRLANNPDELQAIRLKLEKNRLTEPLFDTPRFTRNLEKAYKEMWKLETRNLKLETRNLKLETRNSKLETRNLKLETRNLKLETRNSKLETRNSKLGTRNLKLGTRNSELGSRNSGPKPQAPSPKPQVSSFKFQVSSFKKAVQFHQAGRLQEAEEIYKKILETDPDHSGSLHFLGVLSHQTGQNDRAAELIRRAVRIYPDEPYYHFNLGCVFQAQGKFNDAVSCFQNAVRLKPDYFEAYTNMGSAFEKQGKLDNSLSCYRKALEMKPDLVEAYNNMGSVFQAQGKFNDAISCFRRSLKIRPDNPDTHNNMGNVFGVMSNTNKAVSCFQRAVQLKPDYFEAYNNMGKAFQNQGNLDHARSCFQKSLELKKDHAETHCYLGNVLSAQNLLDDAMKYYRKALDITPNFSNAVAGQAGVFMKKGEFDRAHQCLLPLIRSGSRDVVLIIAYAQLAGRFNHRSEAVDLLEEILAHGRIGFGEKCQIHFNLGKLYDDLGEYDAAFRHYRQGNELKQWPFDSGQHEAYITRMISLYDPKQKTLLPKAGNDSEMPVFILGMPRSGTTLTEQILASHPQVFGAGELTDIGSIAHRVHLSPNSEMPHPEHLRSISGDVLDGFANHYLEKLKKLSDNSLRVTNKMPQNFLYIGLISQLFPKAKIIHCVRDPRDVGLSVYFQNFLGSHDYAFDLKNIAAYYNQYKRMMRHWRDVFGVHMLEVRYEELVLSQEAMTREMVAYLGLDWDERCMDFHKSERSVITASYQQVREPVYTRSVGRWKNYEKYLEPLNETI
ncbi:tetratricopeptide repeat protein [Desulfonema magnum]|uniref:protein O-GlcNAc transferase n=1 Tax=Desulfonema magnum TaxID=45655 RepID=A0A975BTV1_9BACT|nr:tetratricopeptide repeat protein [Desulfonema magnum]QTA91412.1 Tetratricopeptide repeat-containing protein [Desulfonema magnum]